MNLFRVVLRKGERFYLVVHGIKIPAEERKIVSYQWREGRKGRERIESLRSRISLSTKLSDFDSFSPRIASFLLLISSISDLNLMDLRISRSSSGGIGFIDCRSADKLNFSWTERKGSFYLLKSRRSLTLAFSSPRKINRVEDITFRYPSFILPRIEQLQLQLPSLLTGLFPSVLLGSQSRLFPSLSSSFTTLFSSASSPPKLFSRSDSGCNHRYLVSFPIKGTHMIAVCPRFLESPWPDSFIRGVESRTHRNYQFQRPLAGPRFSEIVPFDENLLSFPSQASTTATWTINRKLV